MAASGLFNTYNMKKRLIKKAFKCAAKGIHTRIIPRGNGGKNIALFIQFKVIGLQAKKMKSLKKPDEIMKSVVIIALAGANIKKILWRPIPNKFKVGGVAAHGGEYIIPANEDTIISCQ